MQKNRNAYIWIVLVGMLMIGLSGCRPRGVLSSNAMREVLVDLHKTDAMLQVAGLRPNDQEVKNIYYAQVLHKHGITQAQFDSSLVWYTDHPQLFNKIYPKVLADLEKEEEQLTIKIKERDDAPRMAETKDIQSCVQFDTTYFALLDGYYPILRQKPWINDIDSLRQGSLMQDSINQLLP